MTKAELIEMIIKLPIQEFEVESITKSCEDETVVGLMIADASIEVGTEEEVLGNC